MNLSFRFLFLIILLMIGSCSTTTNFSPKPGEACLPPREFKIWSETTPGDEPTAEEKDVSGQDIFWRLSNQYFSQMLNIIDMGGIAKKFSKVLKGDMPQCGNWCGSGYPLPSKNPPTIDPLDEACKKHDLCYRTHGNHDCKCDEKLGHEIIRGRRLSQLTPFERKVIFFFSGSDCVKGCKQMAGVRHCTWGYQ